MWVVCLCVRSNIESAPPTARLTKNVFRNGHSNLSAKVRCVGVAWVASRSGSTPQIPPRARCPLAPPGESARFHADRGDGFTMGRPLSQFVRRLRLVRRWSTPSQAQETRRTHASAVATGSATLRHWRSSTRFASRLTCPRESGCLVGAGTAKSRRRFGKAAGESRCHCHHTV